MWLTALKVLMVWLPVCGLCLARLPLQARGRLAFCLGFSLVWSLLLTGLLMWGWLLWFETIMVWWPMALVALLAGLLFVITPAPAAISLALPVDAPLSRFTYAWWLVVVLATLVVIRFLGLLPDVLARPLVGWDAWTVWAYEARVWFEQGGYLTLRPPSEWGSAPTNEWVRFNLVEYPKLVPALLLWSAGSAEVWGMGGANLLWWLIAVGITLMVFGVLRQCGLSLPWALLGAYLWASLPMVSAHVVIYGYADLWMGAALTSFAAAVVMAQHSRQRLWWGVALMSLLILPALKIEGTYWLLIGAVALVLAGVKLRLRWLMGFALAALLLTVALQGLGWDLLGWLTRGRLSLSMESFAQSLAGGAAHAFQYYDWHVLFYLALGVLGFGLLQPQRLQAHYALSAFVIMALLLLWVLTPITDAGAWLTQGTLFSRVALHVSGVLVLFMVLLLHDRWREAQDD